MKLLGVQILWQLLLLLLIRVVRRERRVVLSSVLSETRLNKLVRTAEESNLRTFL